MPAPIRILAPDLLEADRWVELGVELGANLEADPERDLEDQLAMGAKGIPRVLIASHRGIRNGLAALVDRVHRYGLC